MARGGSPTIVEGLILLAILGILGSIVSNGCRRSGGGSTASTTEGARGVSRGARGP